MKCPNIPRTAVHLDIVTCLVIALAASRVLALEQTSPVPSTDAPSVKPSTAASSAPTSAPSPSPARVGKESTLRLYMPDGQLKSHSIRVYVSRDIQPNQNPQLRLLRSHAVTKKDVDEA